MIYSSVFCLLIICMFVMIWGFKREGGIYEFPFITAVTFLMYIIPQAFGLYNNPFPVSPLGLELTMLMGIFCLLCCWRGYAQAQPNHSILSKLNFTCSVDKLFHCGIIYTVIGTIFFYLIGQLPTELTEETQWSGITVAYLFFAQLIYPGFAMLLIPTLLTPSPLRYAICFPAIFLLMIRGLVLARRTEMALLLLITLVSFFFIKKYTVPRSLVILGVIIGLLYTHGIGEYRSEIVEADLKQFNLQFFFLEFTWLTDLIDVILKMNWFNVFDRLWAGEASVSDVLRYGAATVEATNNVGQFGLGTGYWNRVVFHFIPRQIVGSDIKQMFYFPAPDYHNIVFNYFKTQAFRTGLTVTVIGELFREFWFFGAFLYWILAGYFKQLWFLAASLKNPIFQVFYVIIIPFVGTAVSHGLANLFVQFIYYIIFMIPVILYSVKGFSKSPPVLYKHTE